jgi:hypothetical protein
MTIKCYRWQVYWPHSSLSTAATSSLCHRDTGKALGGSVGRVHGAADDAGRVPQPAGEGRVVQGLAVGCHAERVPRLDVMRQGYRLAGSWSTAPPRWCGPPSPRSRLPRCASACSAAPTCPPAGTRPSAWGASTSPRRCRPRRRRPLPRHRRRRQALHQRLYQRRGPRRRPQPPFLASRCQSWSPCARRRRGVPLAGKLRSVRYVIGRDGRAGLGRGGAMQQGHRPR